MARNAPKPHKSVAPAERLPVRRILARIRTAFARGQHCIATSACKQGDGSRKKAYHGQRATAYSHPHARPAACRLHELRRAPGAMRRGSSTSSGIGCCAGSRPLSVPRLRPASLRPVRLCHQIPTTDVVLPRSVMCATMPRTSDSFATSSGPSCICERHVVACKQCGRTATWRPA